MRWGVSPAHFDAALSGRARGLNLGLDGFTPRFVYPLIETGVLVPKDSGIKVVVIGLNMVETISIAEIQHAPASCGALQRPVLTSPFGADYGLDIICDEPVKFSLERELQRFKIFRYRKPLRAWAVGQAPAELQSEVQPNGFQPYPPAGAVPNYYEDFRAGLEAMRKTESWRFEPLAADNWREAAAPGGAFDRYDALLRARGMLPAFLALPTNPFSLDVFAKRETYLENSAILKDWAADRGAIFIDLGIKDNYDPEMDFADFRHLSGTGAAKFSLELGAAFAADSRLMAALGSD
jgi:hypothetical protein